MSAEAEEPKAVTQSAWSDAPTVHAALQEYHSQVRAKILGQAIVESSTVAATAVQELTQSHARMVEQLNAQITELQEQLFNAAGVIEMLGGQAVRNTTRISQSMMLPTSIPGFSSAEQHSFVVETGTSSHEVVEGEPRNTGSGQPCVPHPEEVPSDAFFTAQSGSRCTDGSLRAESDMAQSALFAELIQSRGTLKLRQQQQAQAVAQLKELTAMLAKVVRENVAYRQEINLLRTSTVPIGEHLQLFEQRNSLEQECCAMRLELQRLEAEMELALGSSTTPQDHPHEQQVEGEGEGALAVVSDTTDYHTFQSSETLLQAPPTEQGDVTIASSTTNRVFHPARSHHDDDDLGFVSACDEAELRHGDLWKTAIRELEQQAALAATQLSAAERLREAEDRIEELNAAQAELRMSMEKLEAEDKCVREDCEHLLFRNGVLSQQVASLLVRVERQRRVLDRLQQKMHEEDNGKVVEHSVSSSEVILEGEEPSWRGSRYAKRGRVAAAAQGLLERRSAVSAHGATGASDSLCGLLDVTLQSDTPLEIECGVRTGLGVFAQSSHRPRRTLMLRNMGSPPIETEASRVPLLPASDQLSGVALGRPPNYRTLGPAPLTASDSLCGSSNNNSSSGGGGTARREGRSLLGSTATTLVMSEDAMENKQFLDILCEDENLDRFSVNSVAELVQRNQELLQQLYKATQRANATEEPNKEELKSRATSDTEAAQPHHQSSSKRRRMEADSDGRQSQHERESSDAEGAARGDALDLGDVLSHTPDSGMHMHEVDEKGKRRLLLIETEARYMQLERHVEEHIDAILQKHKAQLTLADENLSESLLRIIELGQESSRSMKGSDEVSTVMKDALISSLVRMCTQQGICVADQAIALATSQQSGGVDIIRECWREAQRVLQNSVTELKVAIADLPQGKHCGEGHTGVISLSTAKDEGSTDEVQLLHSIASLLRTASLKEQTIQRVLQLATRRHRMVQKAVSAAAASLRPKGATQQQQEEQKPEEENEEGEVEDDVLNDGDEMDDDDDDEQNIVQRLRSQLDEAHAQHEKLLVAHHEERKQHTVLLDRMWRVEEKMVDAVRSRDEALHRMESMMTREEYEATVDALDTSKAFISDLEAQLRHAREENMQQLDELDVWRKKEAEHDRRRVADAAAVAAELAQKDRLISQQVNQNHLLELRHEEQQASIRQFEEEMTRQRSEIADRGKSVQELQEQLRRVELALLEQHCTQDLLLTIFPGDRALEENCNLIHSLHQEKEQLVETIAALQLNLDLAHRELAAARMKIHSAEQARQDAELRMQESALARLVETKSVTSTTTVEMPSETTMMAETSAQHEELVLLRRSNASLLVEKRDWMEREALLRQQLDALGRDPVSETARRYGLQATRSFEEQVEELHSRCVMLQEKLADTEGLQKTVHDLKDNVASLTAQLAFANDALVRQEEAKAVLEDRVHNTVKALQEESESHVAMKLSLVEKEELINSITSAISTLEAEAEMMEQRLRTCEEERQQLFQNNLKLMESVEALTKEVKKKEAERKAAQTALAQGLANTSLSSHRWRGRSAGTGGTAVSTPITGTLGRTPP